MNFGAPYSRKEVELMANITYLRLDAYEILFDPVQVTRLNRKNIGGVVEELRNPRSGKII
jgi:hypothetical protein